MIPNSDAINSRSAFPKRIKVLHIITVFSIGGATENTLFTVEGLKSLGYDVSILTGPNIPSEGSLFKAAWQSEVNVTVINELRRSIHPFYDVIAFFEIFKIIRKGKFHIVHTHSSKAGLLGRLAARCARTPIIIHTIHGLPFHKYQNKLIHFLFIFAEKVGTAISDKVVTVTNTIIDEMLTAGISRRNKFVMIRSGFFVERFMKQDDMRQELKEKLGLLKDNIVVGKVARFSLLKGYNYIIEAIPEIVKQVPKVMFLFVGSGELEQEMRQRAKELGISNYIIFAGLVEQEKMPYYISIMDVVVHTSLLEGLARVLPQALAAGKPVVSFDINGVHEVVIEGKTGYLVDPESPKQLVKAIVNLINNPQLAQELGANGAEFVKESWTVSAMVDEIHKVYCQLLKEKKL